MVGLAKVRSLRLANYKRIGRVYSLDVLMRIYEESKHAREGEGEN